MNTTRQRYLEFDTTDSPASLRRRARCQRLLASLGLPPEKITTGNLFDYDTATRIATKQTPAASRYNAEDAT